MGLRCQGAGCGVGRRVLVCWGMMQKHVERGNGGSKGAIDDEFWFTMDTERIRVRDITRHSAVCVDATSYTYE